MGAILTNISEIFAKSGWAQIFFTEGGWKYAVMLAVACVLLYLAIVKQFSAAAAHRLWYADDQPAPGRHLPHGHLHQ